MLEDEVNRVREGATIFVMAGDYKEIPISLPAKNSTSRSRIKINSIRAAAINDLDVVLGSRNEKGEQIRSTNYIERKKQHKPCKKRLWNKKFNTRGLTGVLRMLNTYGTKRPNRWSICKFRSEQELTTLVYVDCK